VGLANLGSESETCVGSRVRLVGVFISFEKNFYRLPFTPPLSGSPYRSFTLALDEALVANMEKMVNEDLDSTTKHAGSFEAAEQTKEVPLDPAAPEGKALSVSSTLDPK
jgi:hypothetical protein